MRGRGFSLIELVIVVMIIAIVGAIEVTRVSRGSEGASVNAYISSDTSRVDPTVSSEYD